MTKDINELHEELTQTREWQALENARKHKDKTPEERIEIAIKEGRLTRERAHDLMRWHRESTVH